MAVVCPVPRRSGVARLEASFATRLPVAGYTRGAVASGAPGASRCCGVGWVHAPVVSVGLWRAQASGLPGAGHRLGPVG